MFEYNYLVTVPKGFMPKVNQMLYNDVAMQKTHELIYGDTNYVLINKVDFDAVAKRVVRRPPRGGVPSRTWTRSTWTSFTSWKVRCR